MWFKIWHWKSVYESKLKNQKNGIHKEVIMTMGNLKLKLIEKLEEISNLLNYMLQASKSDIILKFAINIILNSTTTMEEEGEGEGISQWNEGQSMKLKEIYNEDEVKKVIEILIKENQRNCDKIVRSAEIYLSKLNSINFE